jgi:two-component system LytT family sensor kinase
MPPSLQLGQQLALLLLLIYLFSKSPAFRPVAKDVQLFKYRLFVGLILAGIGMLGFWLAATGPGLIVDGGTIGILLAGLVAGPLAGVAAGLLGAAATLWFYGPLGSAIFAGSHALLQGLLAGLFHLLVLRKNRSEGLFSPLLTLNLSLLVLLLQLLSGRLFFPGSFVADQGMGWLQNGIAAILVAAATALAMMMIRDSRSMSDKVGALFSARALNIAERSLGIFGAGFNAGTAHRLATIIFEETDVGAVGISDCEQTLAFVGEGADHHLPGLKIASPQTRMAIRENRVIYADGVKEHFNCALSDHCSLGSALIVPLRVDTEVVGTIKLYEPKDKLFLNLNKTLGEGIAKLLSEQLLRYRYEEQRNLVVTSELRLIQAQINPHFLFNALNTIVAVVRKDADQARSLLLHLSNYFRKNLKRSGDLATLEEELDHVNSYLVIQKARFGDKLQIEQQIEEGLLSFRMPTFTLQPIVENAVKHGISNMLGVGVVRIRALRQPGLVRLIVEDDAGAYREQLQAEGLGMNIVDKRIKNQFGNQYGSEVTCVPEELTRVTLSFPDAPGERE